MNGFYFIIQIDQKRSRIFVKGNEITIPLSSQFSSSNIQKKEGNKNYTKEKTISISHQLIFEGIICTTREFLISGLNTTSSKVDLYIPWNDRCSPIHKQLPVPGWIEIHPIIGEFDGL